jgi:hypothetical protein
MEVTLCAQTGRVLLRKRAWQLAIARDDLPGWIALYRALKARAGGKFAEFYAADLAALERFERECP